MDMEEHKISIIGKGMIGIGFAALLTGNGIPVTVLAKDVAIGRARYRDIFSFLEANHLVTPRQTMICEKLLSFAETYEEIADTQIVLECVVENLAVKQNVYRELESHCKHLLAIASASSALSPDILAETVTRKDLLLVAHPYNPAYLVPCVEVVSSQYTSQQATDVICTLLTAMKREVIVMQKAAPGFIANRIQHAMIREALHMVQEGIATPEDIDRAIKTSFAPRYTSVGLLENIDNAGLDLEASVEDYLFPELGNSNRAPTYMTERISRGDLGAKTGQGIFTNWTKEKVADLTYRAAKPYLSYFNWSLPNK